MAQTVIGVDVAKDWIDVKPRGGKGERIAMEAGALRRFAERRRGKGRRWSSRRREAMTGRSWRRWRRRG